ncbi:MAG TPA: hypothetical protein VHB30_13255 [Solirubrobacteraceae bacterium]|nr:hypothetical protein [Solirubrobacteraceae bacterium]
MPRRTVTSSGARLRARWTRRPRWWWSFAGEVTWISRADDARTSHSAAAS